MNEIFLKRCGGFFVFELQEPGFFVAVFESDGSRGEIKRKSLLQDVQIARYGAFAEQSGFAHEEPRELRVLRSHPTNRVSPQS